MLAAVVADGPVDPAEILAWCAGRIPAFAVPRFVRVVDALPKTPSEKVRKAALRADGIPPGTYDRERSATVPVHPTTPAADATGATTQTEEAHA